MINIRPLIEQRIYAQVMAFKEVAGAASLASVLAGRMADPGCYVVEESRRAGENDTIGAVMQRVTVTLGAIIVVRNVKDARGTDAADASHVLQTSVQTALLGWTPAAELEPLEYAGGSLISFAGGFFIWKDSFKTAGFMRAI